jgi:hypothetical protein
LRIRFFGWRRAEPFLTLGISASLKKFSLSLAHWRQLICREPILRYITELATQAEKQACLIDYSLSSIDYFLCPSFSELDSDCSGCSTGDNCRTFYPPAPFGVFAAHKMTAAAATSADFTGSSDFDPFAQTLVGFLFRHLIASLNIKAVIYNICICWSIP